MSSPVVIFRLNGEPGIIRTGLPMAYRVDVVENRGTEAALFGIRLNNNSLRNTCGVCQRPMRGTVSRTSIWLSTRFRVSATADLAGNAVLHRGCEHRVNRRSWCRAEQRRDRHVIGWAT